MALTEPLEFRPGTTLQGPCMAPAQSSPRCRVPSLGELGEVLWKPGLATRSRTDKGFKTWPRCSFGCCLLKAGSLFESRPGGRFGNGRGVWEWQHVVPPHFISSLCSN